MLFTLEPWHHHFMPAAGTADFEVHTGTQHKEGFAPAWMRFFHLQDIAGPYIHVGMPPFYSIILEVLLIEIPL